MGLGMRDSSKRLMACQQAVQFLRIGVISSFMKRMKGNNDRWPWIIATLLAQTGWGAYPVLARYLQKVSSLPSMSIIAFGSLLALLVVGFFLFPRVDWKTFRSSRLLLFGLVVVGRGISCALLSLGILAGANIAQIGSIRHLGAAMVSSTLAWKLVSALFLAALLLGDRLTSIFEVLGVVLVLATITWYLWQQRGPARPSAVTRSCRIVL